MSAHLRSQVLQLAKLGVFGLAGIFVYGYVGPEAFGIYGAALAMAAYSFVLDGTALAQGFQIDYRRTRSGDLFATGLVLALLCAALLVPCVFLLARLGSGLPAGPCLALAAIFAANPVKAFLANYMVVSEKLPASLAIDSACRILGVGGMVAAHRAFPGLGGVDLLLCSSGIETAAWLAACGALSGLGRERGSFSRAQARSLLAYAWPLVSSSLFTGFLYHSIRVVVSQHLSRADFGKLTFMDNIFDKLKGPSSLYITHHYPRMLDGMAKEGFLKTSRREFLRLAAFTAILVLPVTAAVLCLDWILAIPALRRLGEIREYLFAILYLSLLRPFAGLAVQLVVADRRNMLQSVSGIVSVTLQLALAYLGTRYYGLPGAFAAFCLNSMVSGCVLYGMALWVYYFSRTPRPGA